MQKTVTANLAPAPAGARMMSTQNKQPETARSEPESHFRTMKANPEFPNTGGWKDRHNKAIQFPRAGFEDSLVAMINGWQQYAHTVNQKYESKIGKDYVLGPEWESIGKGILGLLNGESGRLDCGTLDAFIRDTMTDNGIETQE